MRIVDFLTIVLGTSLTSVYVHSKPVYGYSTLLLTDDIIRVKKRNEDSAIGYLEQCGSVTFPMAQRGVVNVLAFLDSSWPYSHRQAIMLKMLNDRLRRSGLPDALFFVVNVDPSFLNAPDDAEDDIEKEAWLGVSPDEIDRFSETDRTTESLKLSVNPDIQLIQDSEDLGIWKELRGSRDQVLVIDRCGKLTYQVIVPWSILHFPYVKAAILSTYKDEPCGPCDIIRNATDALYRKKTETTSLDYTTDSFTTKDYFHRNDRESTIASDIPITTESILRVEDNITTVDNNLESFVSSTSKYEDKSNRYINEETSIAEFPEFDLTSESTTTPNLISEKYSYTEFESVKPDEFTTSMFTDITTARIYNKDLRESEDEIFPNFLTSDAPDSTDTVTSAMTEVAPNPETTTTTRLGENEEVMINEHYFHQTERNNETSWTDEYDTVASTVTSGITTEETLSSDTDDILSIKYQSTNSKNDTEPEVDDATISSSVTPGMTSEDSTTSFRTMDSVIDTTTEETLSSDTDDILSIKYQSMNSKNDTEPEVDDATISSYGTSGMTSEDSTTSFRTTEDIVDTTTEETLDSNTSESLGIREDTKENEDTPVPQDSFKGIDETEEVEGSFEMPIRIIMHAPHFHADGDSTRMHEYLILKTGSSDHHSHLSSRDATRLYGSLQDFHEKIGNIPNEEIEAKPWPMTNVIYNRDESPGLYGEVADFWRGTGSQETYDDAEDTERPEEEQIAEENDSGLWNNSSKSNNKNPPKIDNVVTEKSFLSTDDLAAALETTDLIQADVAHEITTKTNPINIEEFNAEEEETRNKLIAHYSKLLPWIYYVLDK